MASNGNGARYTADEVATQTGLTVEQARKLWRALGFPEVDDEAAFDEADIDAVRTVREVMNTGQVDFDLIVNITRGLGQSMARLTDWEVSAILHRFEELAATEEDAEPRAVLDRAIALSDDIGKPFEQLLVYAWRRHLRAATARVEGSLASAEDLGTTRVSVGFADIVSFTALSNSITEGKIGDLVELFESRCADVVAMQHGRVIKSLGDSVLFVNPDPIRAYDTAEGIINVIGRDQRMPDVRVGLASGSVVTRLGDVYGPPVNMAARLTAVARRNRIIIDDATADLLPSEQFETRRLAARPVRGFGIVEPVAVRRI